MTSENKNLNRNDIDHEWYWKGRHAVDAGDFEQAFDCYLLAAAQGDPWGQCEVGRCYRRGIGVAKNEELAIKYALMAASVDDFGGCFDAGVAYAKGIGVDKNGQKAIDFFERASRHEESPIPNRVAAINWVGICLIDLFGNVSEALAVHERALGLTNRFGGNDLTRANCYCYMGHAEFKLGHYSNAKDCWKRELQLLYEYAQQDESFDYDSDPRVDKAAKNIVAAEHRMQNILDMGSSIFDVLPK